MLLNYSLLDLLVLLIVLPITGPFLPNLSSRVQLLLLTVTQLLGVFSGLDDVALETLALLVDPLHPASRTYVIV